MGTEVHYKSYLPGYYSMRDINEDSNSSSWPLLYGDKSLTNGHYYNGYMPRTISDAYPGYDKDTLKQKMLEHEAIFKDQVYELHRLYRRQRDMMEEVKRKELHKHRISIETSSSSSFLPSQIPGEDARKWHNASFLSTNSNGARPSMLGSENINSPLSCTKGNSSKDCEVLECRPSKVRKKLFDLQLPAEVYIDTEEGKEFQDNKISDISSYPNGNRGIAPRNGVKLFLNGVNGKTDCYGDASSDPRLRSCTSLADLNEPVHIEEANAPRSIDFLGHPKPTSNYVGLPSGLLQKSQNGSIYGALNNLPSENKGNGRDWLSSMCETGNGKSNMNFTSQHLQPDRLSIPSHTAHLMHSKNHQTAGIFPVDHFREDSRRDRPGSSSEVSNRILEHSNYNHPPPFLSSHISGPYPFVSSADMASCWPHSVSSWGKPSNSLTHKLTPVQTNPSYLSSSHSNEIFGDKWQVNGNSRSVIASGSDRPTRNGFYQRSSSGSKELSARLPSAGFDYLNWNKGESVASVRLTNYGSQKPFNASDCIDLNSSKEMNLNNDAVPQQGPGIIDDKRKSEDHRAVLPWLRAKPAVCKNDASSTLLFKNETAKGPCHTSTHTVSSVSNDHVVGTKRRSDVLGNGKILGFPIFGNQCTSKNESSSLVTTSASLHCAPESENIKLEMKREVIDINVAWDDMSAEPEKLIEAEPLIVDKEMDTKFGNFRNQFDLNSCVTEDEDLVTVSVKSTSGKAKNMVEIDLEALPVPEVEETNLYEEEQKEHPVDEELVTLAAEAIVAISISGQQLDVVSLSTTESDSEDPLVWFVEVVSSCMDSIERKSEKSSSNEIDDFEAMTLQLEETKLEDRMPKLFVPEIQEEEETGPASLTNRPRRGQARRGRPRRDFQRDILPGLASLSRHEVTEDLQIFGGIMRAMGHSWNAGLTRRNSTRSGGRGRRKIVVEPAPPLMEQINNIEVALEERSLTGWGKTTRRPRRQRCPAAGTSVAVQLT